LRRCARDTALSDAPEVTVTGEATDGTAAVAAALQYTADVILMDLHMPGMTGIDATREIHRAAPVVAVLVLTMFDNDESLFTPCAPAPAGTSSKAQNRTRSYARSLPSPPATLCSAPASPNAHSPTSPSRPTAPARHDPSPELTDRAYLTRHPVEARS
jgi:chemotaxis response regulator CheB